MRLRSVWTVSVGYAVRPMKPQETARSHLLVRSALLLTLFVGLGLPARAADDPVTALETKDVKVRV